MVTNNGQYLVALRDKERECWSNAPADAFSDAQVRVIHKQTRWIAKEYAATGVTFGCTYSGEPCEEPNIRIDKIR